MGALGQVTAHADGASGATASFDYGDASAADVQPVAAGSADSEHTYAANGTFTIAVTSGAAAPGSTQVTVADIVAEGAQFDPGAHTIPEVQSYVTANPDALVDVLEAEEGGKNRSTLLAWLEEQP